MKRMRIPSDNLPRCGQQIIKRLLAIGKNQKWLAAQWKVSCTAITYIILGRNNPSFSLAIRICHALACSLDDIFGDVA